MTRISVRSLSLAVLPALLLGACTQRAEQPSLSAQAVSCGVWNASTAYTQGDTVTQNGQAYVANWWTQGNSPDTSNGPAGSGQPWTKTSSCVAPPPPPPPPVSSTLKVGQSYSLQVTNPGLTTRYLRHAGSLGYTEVVTSSSDATLKADASWKVVTGLADANCLSLQSVNFPTQYLRHAGSRARIDASDGSELFKADATWCEQPGLAGSGLSLQSKNMPSAYLRHRGGEVWAEAGSDALYKQDATWAAAPAWSTVTPPPPTPPPPGGLAKHALVGYWHNFTNPSGDTFPLGQVSSDWDVIVVAFADDAGNGNVSFTLDPRAGGESQFISDIAAKRAQGKKVVLSLGGQNGSVTVNSQAQADNFASSLAAILKKYGMDGIDLDLESGSGVTQGAAIQTWLPVAVKSLKSKMGGSLYLSMAPEWPYVEGAYTSYGGIWGAYIPIIDQLRGELTILHPQYYNNGAVNTAYGQNLPAGSTNQLVATARMLIEGFGYGAGKTFAPLRPDQVAFGVPSGPSSAGSGFTTPDQVNSALDCLTRLTNCGSVRPPQAYPTFRGVMTWSINWDRHDGLTFSRPVASKLRTLP